MRQKGGHAYLTTHERGEHHVAVPLHKAVKVGTLAAILASVAAHRGSTRDELLQAMQL